MCLVKIKKPNYLIVRLYNCRDGRMLIKTVILCISINYKFYHHHCNRIGNGFKKVHNFLLQISLFFFK